MAPSFFKINPRSIIPKEWGDYGVILQHGMTAHLPRADGKLALERTGPYIPPITLPGPGDIVLTSEARGFLERSGLSGFGFRQVEKVLIVELHWERWSLDANEPAQYPESGEPEDYILDQPQSKTTAKALGDLWELVIPPTATILRPKSVVSSQRDLKIDLRTWNGTDLFRSADYGAALFTQRGRDWFMEYWGTYVDFEEFPTT